MTPLNFRKTVHRNQFTTIFGGIGRRKKVIIHSPKCIIPKRSKMQITRRAHQGWRNRIYGTINALRLRLLFGRMKSTPQFRR